MWLDTVLRCVLTTPAANPDDYTDEVSAAGAALQVAYNPLHVAVAFSAPTAAQAGHLRQVQDIPVSVAR